MELGDVIQELWSGYGLIQRATLRKARETQQVVIKHIDLSLARPNRRGWGGSNSHERKVQSYEVEKIFYESYSANCSPSSRVPKLIAATESEGQGGWIMVLEDLDRAGFPVRKDLASHTDVRACLAWLAHFHANFLGKDAAGLWPVGTYWHLATRPDEFEAMPQSHLKDAAHRIDSRLNHAVFQTLVHGDAKIANFCFSRTSEETNTVPHVAAVDFQYVGRGCGMKDVAYFVSSCVSGDQATRDHELLLNYYFETLEDALSTRDIAVEFSQLESEWRELYPFAWADFCRFLSGWSPGHWKLNDYAERLTNSVLEENRSFGVGDDSPKPKTR